MKRYMLLGALNLLLLAPSYARTITYSYFQRVERADLVLEAEVVQFDQQGWLTLRSRDVVTGSNTASEIRIPREGWFGGPEYPQFGVSTGNVCIFFLAKAGTGWSLLHCRTLEGKTHGAYIGGTAQDLAAHKSIIRRLSEIAAAKVPARRGVLVKSMLQGDVDEKRAALSALREMSGRDVGDVPGLGQLLLDGVRSKENMVAWGSIEGLAKIQYKPAIPVLIDLLEDEREGVRLAAQKALQTITGRDDFPSRNAGTEERRRSVEKWKAWWLSSGNAKGH